MKNIKYVAPFNKMSDKSLSHCWQQWELEENFLINDLFFEEYILVFVVGGRLEIKYRKKPEFILKEKEMILLVTNHPITLRTIEKTTILACKFSPGSDYLGIKINHILHNPLRINPVHSSLNVPNSFVDFLLTIRKYLFAEETPSFLFEIKRKELFFMLAFYYSQTQLTLLLSPIIGTDLKFRKSVIQNTLQAKNVKELAELLNYSYPGFVKKFQKEFRCSPYQWMRSEVKEQIYHEICFTNRNFAEIADSYKFSSSSHFSSFCRRTFGISPSEIRKRRKFKETE